MYVSVLINLKSTSFIILVHHNNRSDAQLEMENKDSFGQCCQFSYATQIGTLSLKLLVLIMHQYFSKQCNVIFNKQKQTYIQTYKLSLMNDVCDIKDTWTSPGQKCADIGTNKTGFSEGLLRLGRACILHLLSLGSTDNGAHQLP